MMVDKNQKNLSVLDVQLQNMAAINWEGFVAIVGAKNIRKAKICLLRRKGKSLNQIANKLGITKRQVDYSCGHCEKLPDDE